MPTLRRQLPSANALFVFESAARCGNFTKAAAELGVTQPAVSRMLAFLEEYLEVKLFLRTPGKTELTESGEILYQGVIDGFHNIEAAIQEIRARSTGLETVTLSVSTAFTTHWLMPRMHRLQAQLPNIDLRFQLISGPVSGPVEDVDLGIRFVTGEDILHDASLLLPEILVPVCSPAYRQQQLESPSNDLSTTLISLSDSRIDWFELLPNFHMESYGTAHPLVFSDYAVVLQAALLGQGIAIGWLNIASHWLETGSLVPATPTAIATERLCHLVHSRKKPLSDAAKQVREWIIEETRRDVANVANQYPELKLESLLANKN
ncbi:LysR substrate-binding domain-containing protein [Halomonas sp. hl-4]|uniref:LysR substrate-binding domain-containing protein n=1 Tax=Halomonas sp. hl-4 TaxID=1761789 RepID=UPI000BB6F1AA|nr:LysR substrate-binding domain-containing protein [Halomonas sp. hl-4]SNY96882.1 DNA-binding transcriptional regulator, LysR family [Halomonas sp. hl-4]